MKKTYLFTISIFAYIFGIAETPPNVIIINADDLGYGDVGCYGATKVQTPNIDRLAADGRKFTDAHAASAVCSPSRYALITGSYPHRNGLDQPVMNKAGLVMPTDTKTIASVMKDAGYATACIGKWHLGFGKESPDWNGDLKPGPLEIGFDYYFGVPVVNSHPPFIYVENHRVVGLLPDDPIVYGKKAKTKEFREKVGLGVMGGGDVAHAIYDDEWVGTTLTSKAVTWINDKKDQPFFLYLATTNIHHPFTPAPRFKGTSQAGMYGDFIHELDWIVGEIVATLEKHGLTDNTLILFTSDNGGMINMGGQEAVQKGHRMNGGLLGFKFDAWEGGHRVPFIAKWPGKIKANTSSDLLVSNIDFLATMLALTKGDKAILKDKNSINILPALLGDPKENLRDELVLAPREFSHLTLRKGKWLYIPKQGNGGFQQKAVGKHMFGGPPAITYVGNKNSDIQNGEIRKDAPPAQLYNLEEDINQTQNLYTQYPKVVAEMQKRLQYYQNQIIQREE